MREVDLIGFGRSLHFATYRLPRFTKWLGITPKMVDQWLAVPCWNKRSFAMGRNLFFESSGVAAPDMRRPDIVVPRWNLFWHTSKLINRSARVDYLGNLHVELIKEPHKTELANIEFCFLSAKGKEIREALKKGFVELKMRT